MAEYIEREAVIAYLENHKRVAKEQNLILSADEDAIIKFLKEKCPTADVVEVVRCKDCIHKNLTTDGEYDPEDIVCGYHMSDGFREDDFCSYGVRRSDVE